MTEEFQQALVSHLRANGLEAVTAWEERARVRPDRAVAAVSQRGLKSSPPSFQNYLGERFNGESGRWEELYGRQTELVMGFDLYASTAAEVRRGLERLTVCFGGERVSGLELKELSVGEIVYRQENREFMCPVEGRFTFWSTEIYGEDGSFLSFEVKGEQTK